MIKVGQIYEDKGTGTGKMVISNTSIAGLIYLIFTDGSCGKRGKKEFNLQYYSLVAEYPTWQEAVNSKEFKDE